MRLRLQPPPSPVAMGGLSHGNHLAIGMALGFLFMGGGTQTFGTSNEAVASLIIALFPHFPISSVDNRCHLQVAVLLPSDMIAKHLGSRCTCL